MNAQEKGFKERVNIDLPKMDPNSTNSILPGQIISEIAEDQDQIKLGYGSYFNESKQSICASKCGILRKNDDNSDAPTWVENAGGKYTPQVGDSVIGVVQDKMGEFFLVDINTSNTATLSYLDFEGASRRNRPDVQLGDIVYGHVTEAGKEFDAQIKCVNSLGKSDGYGVLKGGYLVGSVPGCVCRRLLQRESVLNELGQFRQFEVVVGVNGYVWVCSESEQSVLVVLQCLEKCKRWSDASVRNWIRETCQ
eukprot:TRINITY_DN4333_c0_g1_i2.p1 TRINITY_DN4333_c0_g1~~TRINITY_DN4333_c0_g1_i2.p1  ORF type:complete len:286 (-),score=41.14 TRINITY_DN4333_c0_g1_i2:720-1472(-)